MSADFSIVERNGIKLISVDCINRLGNYHAYYSTGFGGVSDLPGNCSMNLSMFKRMENESFDNVKKNFRLFADACGFPLSCISLHRETHQPIVTVMHRKDIPDDVFDRTQYRESDGQVTADPSVALFVYAADCCTIMLVDPVHEVSGTTHCGWRNSVNGTIPAFVSAFRQCGGSTDAAVAVIGPSICSKHYSIDHEAAEQFIDMGFLPQLSAPNEDGRFPVDLPAVNNIQLQQNGLHPSRIHIMPWCTWEATDLRLPSYRRDGGQNAMFGGVLYHHAISTDSSKREQESL